MAKRKSGKSKGPAKSMQDLAAAHGVTKAAVAKWLRDVRWEEAGFSRRGPWSAAEIERQRAWRRESLQEDRAAKGTSTMGIGHAKSVAQVKVLMERENYLRVARLIKEKEYVPRAEAEEQEAMKWRAVKSALQQIPKALRQALADAADPALCESIVEGALRAVCMEAFTC